MAVAFVAAAALALATSIVAAACSAPGPGGGPADRAHDGGGSDPRSAAVREVLALHAFFEAWYRGEAVPAGGLERLERALAPGFVIVLPDGETLDRAGIVERVRAARDSSGMRIQVERPVAHLLAGGEVAVCYEEWHTSGGDRSGRASRAVLRPDAAAPGGLLWVRVEETGID